MPINNKGTYRLSEVAKLQVANDWPTAQVIYTSDILEVSSNLYFTNARVVPAVTPLLTTANVLELNNQYFTNVRVLQAVEPKLTTANVIELSSNLYFTTPRARSAFTAGQGIAISANGVISSKGDDTGLGAFNSGINLANALMVSNTFANLVTFDSGDGTNFIVYSLHLTNYSNQTAYVTARYVSGANTILFANLLEMQGPSFVEMQVKPQTYKAGDQLQLQSFSSPTQPANNLVTALVSYQGSADVNFDRTANILTDNNVANIFTTVNRTSIIESIKVVNPNPADIPVSIWFADPSYNIFAYVAANIVVPSFSSIELCDYPKAMRDNFTLRAQKSGTASNPISIFLSTKYTTQYTVTPSTLSVNEGATVTFNIDTLNVGDGTPLYYTLSFFSNTLAANDFVSNVSGSTIVTNDSAIIEITANADINIPTEGDETFRLQLRKNSISGTILAESANVVIKNTSNTQQVSANISSTSSGVILEGSNIIFSLSTTNLGNNQVLYYTTTGNVLTSDFVQGNTGTVTIVDNAANLTLTAAQLASGTKNFVLELRRDSITGTPLYVSGNLLIVDSALAFTNATGGVQSNVIYPDGNYRIHAFTTSGTFTVNGVGAIYPNVEYLIVAGGGAAGTGTQGGYAISGAGGGGGLLTGNVTLATATSYAMVVGAGGLSPGNKYVGGGDGSNSSILSNTLIAIGGGGGGHFNASSSTPIGVALASGRAGGSGGGMSTSNSPLGTETGIAGAGWNFPGTLQQGTPGRTSGLPYSGCGGGGAGGTVRATPYPNNGKDGKVVYWIPASYGANVTGYPAMPAQSGQAFGGGGSGGYYNGAPEIGPWIAAGGTLASMGGGGSYNTAGNVNTGGGGGGDGLPGGSGIVIVRYRTA